MLRRWIMFVSGAAVAAGCSAEHPVPTDFEVVSPLFAKGGNAGVNMGTHLTGDEEVLSVAEGAPHPRDSHAQGQAIFRVSGSSVEFRLIAANIDNVIMSAHTSGWSPDRQIRLIALFADNVRRYAAGLPLVMTCAKRIRSM